MTSRESCSVAFGPEARDAVVLLAVLQVLRRDAAHQRVRYETNTEH